MGRQAKQRRQGPASSDQPVPTSDATPWPSAIQQGHWVDTEGTAWRLRGGDVPEKRVEHLLRSPDVPVLHFHGPDAPTEVAVPDREALWQRVRPYHRGVVQEPGDHTHVDVAEFKDDRRRYLLVIEESC